MTLPQPIAATNGEAELANSSGYCAFCGAEAEFLPVRAETANDMACAACGATVRYRGQAEAILSHFGRGRQMALRSAVASGAMDPLHIYEIAIKGPLHRVLSRLPHYVNSYYWEDLAPGEVRDGVICQDLTKLTFADDVFDLVLSTEVMEHVWDPLLAFREVHRVLKPGGMYIFTIPVRVPLALVSVTRASHDADGEIIRHLPDHFHKSGINEPSLVYTDFGASMFDELAGIGFHTSLQRASFDNKKMARFGTFCALKVR